MTHRETVDAEPGTWCLDPELALVRLCARPRACAPDGPALGAAAARVADWDRFFELGRWHRLVPLINQLHLRHPFLPEPVATRVAEAARANALRALRYSAALVRIVDALEGAAVPVLALKGPVLAAQVYGDPGLRAFSDLDILVREEHVRSAITVLRGLDYQPALPGDETGRHSLRARQHSILHNEASGIHLELHWRLARTKVDFRLGTHEVLDRAEPVPLVGRRLLGLAPEDQFLYLAVHAANDGWRELEDFRCLAEIVTQHPGIDWESCLRRARAGGAGRRVRVAVQILAGLGVSWRRDVLADAVADGPARELSRAAQTSWGVMRGPEPGAFGPTALLVRSFDSRRARAGYALATVFDADEADMAAWRLPRPLYPLYALARPGRLTMRLARRALRRGGRQSDRRRR